MLLLEPASSICGGFGSFWRCLLWFWSLGAVFPMVSDLTGSVCGGGFGACRWLLRCDVVNALALWCCSVNVGQGVEEFGVKVKPLGGGESM